LLGEDGGEEGEDVSDAQLVKKQCHTASRHGNGGKGGGLHHLSVIGAQAELDRAET
jgi:hypothetical protein